MALRRGILQIGQRFQVAGIAYVVTYINEGKGRLSIEPVGLRSDLVQLEAAVTQ